VNDMQEAKQQPESVVDVSSTRLLDADTLKDAERFKWLIKQGLAWRDCYDRDWLPGEWLYAAQDARHFVDKAMAQASNAPYEPRRE